VAALLERMDAVTAAVERLNEDLEVEHELRAVSAEKRAIHNKNLDPELKLRQYLTANDAHEHLREAARRRKKKTAPDTTARVPEHDHARDPGGKVSHDGAIDKKAAADAEARLARGARALL
jgi:hypothetical protein